MIFAKKNPLPLNHDRYEQAFEYMFVLSKGKHSTHNLIKESCKYAGKESTGTIRQDSSGELKPKNTKNHVKDFKIKNNI